MKIQLLKDGIILGNRIYSLGDIVECDADRKKELTDLGHARYVWQGSQPECPTAKPAIETATKVRRETRANV